MSVQSGRPSSIHRGLWDHISKAGPIFPSLSGRWAEPRAGQAEGWDRSATWNVVGQPPQCTRHLLCLFLSSNFTDGNSWRFSDPLRL